MAKIGLVTLINRPGSTNKLALLQSHLRLINKDPLRSGRLPDVPDADDGAAVKSHGTGFSCGHVD